MRLLRYGTLYDSPSPDDAPPSGPDTPHLMVCSREIHPPPILHTSPIPLAFVHYQLGVHVDPRLRITHLETGLLV